MYVKQSLPKPKRSDTEFKAKSACTLPTLYAVN